VERAQGVSSGRGASASASSAQRPPLQEGGAAADTAGTAAPLPAAQSSSAPSAAPHTPPRVQSEPMVDAAGGGNAGSGSHTMATGAGSGEAQPEQEAPSGSSAVPAPAAAPAAGAADSLSASNSTRGGTQAASADAGEPTKASEPTKTSKSGRSRRQWGRGGTRKPRLTRSPGPRAGSVYDTIKKELLSLRVEAATLSKALAGTASAANLSALHRSHAALGRRVDSAAKRLDGLEQVLAGLQLAVAEGAAAQTRLQAEVRASSHACALYAPPYRLLCGCATHYARCGVLQTHKTPRSPEPCTLWVLQHAARISCQAA
jgi:hypothetical protein